MACDLNAIEAAKKDICYMSRASYTLSFSVADADGNAVDLSAKTLVFKVKIKKTDSTAVAELSSTITISGASNNIVGLPLDFDLEERKYHYALKNTTDDKPIMYGRFDVTESVNS